MEYVLNSINNNSPAPHKECRNAFNEGNPQQIGKHLRELFIDTTDLALHPGLKKEELFVYVYYNLKLKH